MFLYGWKCYIQPNFYISLLFQKAILDLFDIVHIIWLNAYSNKHLSSLVNRIWSITGCPWGPILSPITPYKPSFLTTETQFVSFSNFEHLKIETVKNQYKIQIKILTGACLKFPKKNEKDWTYSAFADPLPISKSITGFFPK